MQYWEFWSSSTRTWPQSGTKWIWIKFHLHLMQQTEGCTQLLKQSSDFSQVHKAPLTDMSLITYYTVSKYRLVIENFLKAILDQGTRSKVWLLLRWVIFYFLQAGREASIGKINTLLTRIRIYNLWIRKFLEQHTVHTVAEFEYAVTSIQKKRRKRTKKRILMK
jgi:hypothetical protein